VFFCQELRLGALSPLLKAIGSGCQSMPKTLSKGANNVESCYINRLNSIGYDLARLKTLQKGAGSSWVAGLNILGSGCAAIPKDIIIYIINILNLLLLLLKILLFVINIIFIIIIKSINIKNSIICVINIFIFIIIKSINMKNSIICVINIIIFIIINNINIKIVLFVL
jgi:hypothetical protein